MCILVTYELDGLGFRFDVFYKQDQKLEYKKRSLILHASYKSYYIVPEHTLMNTNIVRKLLNLNTTLLLNLLLFAKALTFFI